MKDQEVHSNYPQPNSIGIPTSRIKLPKKIYKRWNAQGSTKSLNWSYGIESMDIETNNISANLNLEDIKYIWLKINAILETIELCSNKWAQTFLKSDLQAIRLKTMYKQDLALNNHQGLICH